MLMPTPPPIPAFLRCHLLAMSLFPISAPTHYPFLCPHQSLPPLTSPPLSPAGYRMQGAQLPGGLYSTDQHPLLSSSCGSAIPPHQGTQPRLTGWSVFRRPPASPRPCPCHHTICDEPWPVCAKPPLPAPVPHAADHTHTHTCSCPHLHPSRPSSAATFSPCPCFPSRPQPTTHSYALTSPYLPSPLPPFPLQATACKAPSFPVAFTLPTSTPSSRRHADPPFRPTKAPSPG